MPVAESGPSPPLDALEARHAAGLMRVNHAGEVSAQALYQGQALVARDPALRALLTESAREEGDHLVWCARRLQALGARPSRLNPVWYAGSLAVGALAGLMGDRVSLGFLAETERQVESHLTEHLEALPAADRDSRAVVTAMREDEIRHGNSALRHGGAELPAPVGRLMHAMSRLLVRASYHW
jgi:ubiquinone biosynthesis monooxygenase Coq7